MQVIKMKDVPEKVANIPLFTGGQVTFQRLVGRDSGKDFTMLMVNFSKGARNKFHAHNSDQILIVTAGKGIIATDKEEKVIEPGDIVVVPANEKHWHGATKDTALSHIALEVAGAQLTQLEP